MSQQDVETVRSAYDAFNRKDIPAVLALYDPQIEWIEAGAFVRMRTRIDEPGFPESISIFGSDSTTRSAVGPAPSMTWGDRGWRPAWRVRVRTPGPTGTRPSGRPCRPYSVGPWWSLSAITTSGICGSAWTVFLRIPLTPTTRSLWWTMPPGRR